jgi:Bardet-Biedl syndrome 2 protein
MRHPLHVLPAMNRVSALPAPPPLTLSPLNNPPRTSLQEGLEHPQTNYINVNRQITAVKAGCVSVEGGRDTLFIGTSASLQAYDVERNRDLFFKDIGEGVSSIAVGRMGRYDHPMVVVGGNCSIQGFDAEGEECFWTVTGEEVSAMELADLDGDGRQELLVGSRDFEVRIFRNEDIIADITEADAVTGLCALGTAGQPAGGQFGYALSNGTVGVYERGARKWRVKSKHTPTALAAYDLDGDGVDELVTGWDNGRVEVRNQATGDVFFRTSLSASVASLLVSDFRKARAFELVTCSTSGEVRGFTSAQDDERMLQVALDKQMADLNRKKQDILYELSSESRGGSASLIRCMRRRFQYVLYFVSPLVVNCSLPPVPPPTLNADIETTLRNTSKAGQKQMAQWGAGFSQGAQADVGESLPVGTVVKVTQAVNRPQSSLDFIFSVNNGCCIKGIVIMGEGLFEGTDALFHQPSVPTSDVVVPLVPARNVINEEIVSRVFVATSFSSAVVRSFELRTKLPRFCMFTVIKEGLAAVARPISFVRMPIRERVQRFGSWMESRFQVHVENLEAAETLEAVFQSLRDGVVFVAGLSKSPSQPGVYDLTVHCDDMDLSGDLLQDACDFLGVEEGSSHASYPAEMDQLRGTLQRVEDANAMRLKMQADTADSAQLVKALVVKAEDSRLLRDMPAMRRMYSSLLDVNRELMLEHTKRATNQEALLDALKQVNAMIQKAAKLRRGKNKTGVVSACRTAIKNNNFQSLFKIIENGSA